MPTPSKMAGFASQNMDDVAGERWQVEAELLQLAQPVRSFDPIHLGYLRGHSDEVARHHPCPYYHAPCADGRVLESCAQDVVRPQCFFERVRQSATGRCSSSVLSNCRRARRRALRMRDGIRSARLPPRATAVLDGGGGGLPVLFVGHEGHGVRPPQHGGCTQCQGRREGPLRRCVDAWGAP